MKDLEEILFINLKNPENIPSYSTEQENYSKNERFLPDKFLQFKRQPVK